MYSTILLPIDLNHEASWSKALPLAAQMAQAGGGRLHLLAILPDFGSSLVAGYFPSGFLDKAMADAKQALEPLARQSGAATETHVAHGHVSEQVLTAAEAVKADLIVMASHPPDQLRELLVGSNADKIVRASPISVLVVR